MTYYDWLRVAAFVAASLTYGLAVANLVVSFQVLRPRPFTLRNFAGSGGGFLWSHIVCVVIPFQGFVTWGCVEVAVRIGGGGPSWRAWALLILCLMISVGYVIIFRVEMARLRLRRSLGDAP